TLFHLFIFLLFSNALPTATLSTLSLHDALPICHNSSAAAERVVPSCAAKAGTLGSSSVQMISLLAGSLARVMPCATIFASHRIRSEEHTSELQSHLNLVCRLLLEKKNKT